MLRGEGRPTVENVSDRLKRPKRWVVLAAFAVVAGVTQMLWLNFAPLLGLVQTRYGVGELTASALILRLSASCCHARSRITRSASRTASAVRPAARALQPRASAAGPLSAAARGVRAFEDDACARAAMRTSDATMC